MQISLVSAVPARMLCLRMQISLVSDVPARILCIVMQIICCSRQNVMPQHVCDEKSDMAKSLISFGESMTRFNTVVYLLFRAGEQSFSVASQQGVP